MSPNLRVSSPRYCPPLTCSLAHAAVLVARVVTRAADELEASIAMANPTMIVIRTIRDPDLIVPPGIRPDRSGALRGMARHGAAWRGTSLTLVGRTATPVELQARSGELD